MKLTFGYPFWLIKDGLPFHYPKLTENAQTDVVIIGGGISGALTAYYLTRAGISAVLVDARTIGLGSTCACTSLVQYELDVPLHKLIEKVGADNAIQAYRLSGEAITKLNTIMNQIGYKEFSKTASLFYSTHASEKLFMAKEYNARKKAGFNVSLLEKTDMLKEYGMIANYAIRSEEGSNINAYSLTHAILQDCLGKGLTVFDRTNITDIRYGNNTSSLTTGEGYKIKAKYLVNATGFEVVNFIKKNIVSFYCTYAIITEHQEEKNELWKNRNMMWSTDDPYLYIRLTKDNRIIVGGRDEKFSNSVTREKFLDKKANLLIKDFKKLFPSLSYKNEFAWSGTFGKTKDSMPYIGTLPGTPNTFYALGFGGNGIIFSLIAAEIILDLITGKKNNAQKLFSFER